MIGYNKYLILGMIMIVVGMILTPLIVGIPILVAGFLVGNIGIWYGLIKRVPGMEAKLTGFKKMIINSYRPYFKKRRIT